MSYPRDYVVFDLETTGLSPKNSKIIEIGALKYKNFELVDEFSYLINPEEPIPDFITSLTGITDNMVKDKETIDTILPKFLDFIDGLPVIGHNINFDISFIKYYAKLLNLNMNHTGVFDTLNLSRKVFKETPNHKLQTLKEYMNLEYDSHRATDDCFTCNSIYVICTKELEK